MSLKPVVLLALIFLGSACSPRKAATPPPSQTPEAPAPPPEPQLAYELRLGQAVYRHYCMTCHGEAGAGDGFNAFNLDPRPKDLSDPALQKAKSDADLMDAVRRGGAGVGLSPLMPPWGRTLTPVQIEQVVGYIRTFRK